MNATVSNFGRNCLTHTDEKRWGSTNSLTQNIHLKTLRSSTTMCIPRIPRSHRAHADAHAAARYKWVAFYRDTLQPRHNAIQSPNWIYRITDSKRFLPWLSNTWIRVVAFGFAFDLGTLNFCNVNTSNDGLASRSLRNTALIHYPCRRIAPVASMMT